MTGLKNKSALTREINDFLSDPATDKGIMFMLDIDRFKAINDTFGHDIGDDVIRQLGMLLGKTFINNVTIPNTTEKISLSIGIAIYNGIEKNYSEIFKKADIALYKSKADSENRFYIYE